MFDIRNIFNFKVSILQHSSLRRLCFRNSLSVNRHYNCIMHIIDKKQVSLRHKKISPPIMNSCGTKVSKTRNINFLQIEICFMFQLKSYLFLFVLHLTLKICSNIYMQNCNNKFNLKIILWIYQNLINRSYLRSLNKW